MPITSMSTRTIASTRPATAALALAAGLVLAGLTGCKGAELETGYKPRALDSSTIQRRAYYAGPFSPAARQAQQAEQQQQIFDARRGRDY
jgi:hypothetical protein